MMELIPPAYSVSSPRFKCRVHFSDASDQSCVFQDLMRYETLCQEGLKACPWEFRPSSASCPRVIDWDHPPPLPSPLNTGLAAGLGSAVAFLAALVAILTLVLAKISVKLRLAVSPVSCDVLSLHGFSPSAAPDAGKGDK